MMIDVKALYLQLMKQCLINDLYSDAQGGLNTEQRSNGIGWPRYAHTMIGMRRLNNIHVCMTDVLLNKIPGDFIETGVWRGGATIFMRAVLKAYNVTDRTIWVADSFCGMPCPQPNVLQDAGDISHTYKELVVSLYEVKQNFARYDLLDRQVKFLKGLFCFSLPSVPIEKLAVMRLDGDMYKSTMDALVNLYPKLSIGGYVIIDDYGALLPCQQAVAEFRGVQGITDNIVEIDWTGVYWQKSGP